MSNDIEIIGNDALGAMERAQIDVQIATARKYPRVLSAVKERMLSFATLDEETAAGCFYTLPARKGGDGRPLQGPSVRMAEIALASYQHLKAGSRIIADDGKFITAQAVVHDLENNVAVSIEVRRRVTTKTGQRFGDDMIAVTGNAACSIALRNATFRVVPAALVKPVYEAAKRVAVGDAKSLTVRRGKILERLRALGVPQERILGAVQAAKVEDIDAARLEVLVGLGTSIKDGEATVEEAFPDPTAGPAKPIFQPPQLSAPADDDQIPGAEIPARQPEPMPAKSPQQQLADLVSGAGFTFDEMQSVAMTNGVYKDEAPSFDDLPAATAAKLLRMKSGLLASLAELRGGGQ
jgi:hypothetical protein